MKRKFFVLPVVMSGFAFSSCADKSAQVEVDTPQKEETVLTVEKSQSSSTQAAMLATVPDELAQKLGAAKMIPKNAEMYMGVKDIQGMMEILFKSKTAKAFEELIDFNTFKEDPDEKFTFQKEVLNNEDYKQFMSVAGEEVFLAFGQGTAKNFKSLMRLTEENQAQGMKNFLHLMLEMLKSEMDENHEFDPGVMGGQMGMLQSEFFRSEDGALKCLKRFEMPTVYAGFKVSDAESREMYTKQLQAVFEMPLEENEAYLLPEKSDKGNGFKGFKWSGKEFLGEIDGMAMNGENPLETMLGKDMYQKMKDELAKKEAVFLVGSVGEYVVFFFGKSEADLQFAKSAGESVLANDDLEFTKDYAGKDIAGLAYVDRVILKSLYHSGSSSMFEAIKEVIAGEEILGNVDDFIKKLDDVVNKEKAFLNSLQYSRYGAIAYYEDGFKIQNYSGDTTSFLDLKSERKLTNMVSQPDSVISASWVTDQKQTTLLLDYLESLASAAHEGTSVAAAIPLEERDWVEFSEVFNMMNGMFKDDLVNVWTALRKDLGNGTSAENAFSMDLKGKMPRIPEVPTVVLENAKVPRFAYATSVTDRNSIQEAWAKLHLAVKNIATNIGNLTEEEIKLPKAEIARKGGLDIWSYQLGVTSYDANAAVALNDELFFLTTSPAYAVELAGKHDTAKTAKGGAEFVIRLDPVRDSANAWLGFFKKHGGDLLSDRENEAFLKNEPLMKKIVEASKEVESISYKAWRGEENRSLLHIKARK